jgi:hypothetical protein
MVEIGQIFADFPAISRSRFARQESIKGSPTRRGPPFLSKLVLELRNTRAQGDPATPMSERETVYSTSQLSI